MSTQPVSTTPMMPAMLGPSAPSSGSRTPPTLPPGQPPAHLRKNFPPAPGEFVLEQHDDAASLASDDHHPNGVKNGTGYVVCWSPRNCSSDGEGPLAQLGRREFSRGVSSVAPSNHPHQSVDFADEKRFELNGAQDNAVSGPGFKMAAAGSGKRLKPTGSYQRRANAAALRETFGGGPDGVTGGLLAPATEGAAGGAEDDRRSLTSAALMDDFGNRQRRRKVATLVPLWVQVCVLMAVPVMFVTAYLGITFHQAIDDFRYLRNNEAVLTQLKACEFSAVQERSHTVVYMVAERHNTSNTPEVRVAMLRERETTNAVCAELIRRTLESKFKVVSRDYHDYVRRAISAISVLRFAVDYGSVGSREYRAMMRRQIALLTNGIMIIARGSTVPRRLLVLSYIRHATNRIGVCRAMLYEIGAYGRLPDEESQLELDRDCVQSFRRYMRDYRELVSSFAMHQYMMWLEDDAAQAGLALAHDIVERGINEPLAMTGEEMYEAVTPAITRLETVSDNFLMNIVEAEQEYERMIGEAIKLFVTLGVSFLGVLFVSRARRLASARVQFALERTHKMSLAVQAFIPRSFLHLMAVESILNLERGDQTQVAVTMLFCDIRNFTGISENMTNEQLFEWLQAHLKRMTRTTEAHRGFVNAYIGDAVSAIFLTPMDACRCAIKMQAVTDALCYELVAHNEDHMVRIGVGVHHAIVGVGILGNDKHHSCAIVSAEVNVANQLEALTKEYGARIIVTAQVHDQLQPGVLESRPLGRVRLSASAAREYVLHEIFQADMPEVKAYKSATLSEWEDVLALRETDRFVEADGLLGALEGAAAMRSVKDDAVGIKRRYEKSACDVFDL